MSGRSEDERLEGISNGANAACPGCAQNALEDNGKHVGVFVRVKVGNNDPRRLELLNLRGYLGFNLLGIELSGRGAKREAGKAVPKAVRGFGCNEG